MRIEKVRDDKRQAEITATGAIYLISKSNPAVISCYQRIGGKKFRGTVTVDYNFEGLKLDYRDEESVILYQPVGDFGFNIRIYADSLMCLRTGGYMQTRVLCQGNWVPEYSSFHNGNALLADRKGGIAFYPLRGRNYAPSSFPAENDIKFTGKSWEHSLLLNGGQTFLTSVFPPRPFNRKQSMEDRIVHHLISHSSKDGWIYLPTDKQIEEYSKNGNILVLHRWNKGFNERPAASRPESSKDAAWAVLRHLPIDNDELMRVVEKAHKSGMRVIPYMAPIFFPGEPDEFIDEMLRVIGEYGFDGVYFDGVASEIWTAYTIMKKTRKALGDKILYVHIPSPIIGNSYNGYPKHYVYCSFIDTYADYILRLEHIFDADRIQKDMRFLLGGCGISNSIAFICNYDYAPHVTKELIRQSFKDNFRIPYWVGWDLYLKERQKAAGQKFYPLEETHRIMKKEYFSVLDR